MKVLQNNKLLFLFIIIFIAISYVSIYSASMYLSPTLGKLYYKQLFWYLIGIVVLIIVSKINIRTLYKYSFLFYIINVFLLIGLLLFTSSVNGSKSWYVINGIGSIQPSEFMKIALILFNSTLIYSFYRKEKILSTKNELKLISLLFLVVLIPSILTFLQPDTGSVIIYFVITLSMLFVSGINKKWFIGLLVFIVIFASTFLYFYFFQENLFIEIFGSNFFYRIDRIINWHQGSGMQLNNSLISIGSAGIIGHGFNNTPIYFPEAGTDFIFTVFSSNFGLIGSILFITFIMLFDIYLIKLSEEVYSIQDKYTIVGIIAVIFYQQVQNIGMTIGLFPITGITLPLISYGGSSLVSYLILIGIIISIKEQDKKKKAYK